MLTMGYSFRPWLRVRSNGHHFIEQQLRRAGSTGETELPERKLRATAEVRRQHPSCLSQLLVAVIGPAVPTADLRTLWKRK
jgi:ribosomal protein L32E